MITLQKWHCTQYGCDTVFYVDGEYAEPPFCTECGMDKDVNCLGFEEFLSAGVEE